MNELDLLRQLGAKLGAEGQPRIDVVGRVIQGIGQRRTPLINARLSLLSVCVGASALLALAVVVAFPPRSDKDSFASLSEAAATDTGPEALLRVLEP